jgi:hypothetical protein
MFYPTIAAVPRSSEHLADIVLIFLWQQRRPNLTRKGRVEPARSHTQASYTRGSLHSDVL